MVQPKLVGAFIVIMVLITIGTTFYYFVEGWSWIDSLFFAVSYLTTVGHATMVPLTDIGKIFTSAYLLVGVSLALYILIDIFGGYTSSTLIKIGEKVTGSKSKK
jgi:voltage-gated potassium channel